MGLVCNVRDIFSLQFSTFSMFVPSPSVAFPCAWLLAFFSSKVMVLCNFVSTRGFDGKVLGHKGPAVIAGFSVPILWIWSVF